ncbi:alpha/beta hydrolase [Patescibacteria group bacterium]|nr:alpha/beta hydrolase [Patescibacteria group bacterium]
MTCALIIGSLSSCILEGHGSQVSDNTDRLIQVGDIKINYRIYGNGYPLVMVMGYGNTMKLWESMLIRSLSSSFKLIVFDNRGMGNTEVGQRPFTIEQFADDTTGLMDALDIQQAHVLGWSMGALIAEEIALRHPAKVNKLILYAAHCNADLFPPAPEVISKLTDMSGTPKEKGMRFISTLFPPDWLRSNQDRIKEIFYRPLGNIPPETMNKQSMAIGNWKGCCDRLGEINKPTLVITGADDVLVPPQNARYLAGKVPNAQLVVYEQGGHGLMFQYPEKFCEKVFDFLR